MRKHAILVTGGAGYIGSHVARQLGEAGETVVVLDDLSTGFRQAVLYGDLIVGNTGDAECLKRLFSDYDIDTVMHFAAHTIVPESVADPLKYYRNNTAASRTLLEWCLKSDVRHFVFSSTAAVYGIPDGGIAAEDSPTQPINPYGTSKLMTELMLRDVAEVNPLNYVALRYFNVAGSDPECRIGQSTPKATLLTKVACEVAVGKRKEVLIFGTDYDTPDGTGVRDYIHVEDLASAHLAALEHLRRGGESTVLNAGYGHGYSVREVIAMVEKVAGHEIAKREAERRAGDPPTLVAAVGRIHETLDWTPRYDDLEKICASSLAWERELAAGRWQEAAAETGT
ncbi:MAG TPA: UDP-glucose 4-epimerase GalE [Gammaproteobacteria bacterium]|nr:UDP-glucose 4-epimerase GalE [Gammaproteobacteria bacterium]